MDGGHFVLLCYEGIRGKPAPENVQIVLSYMGLILVLALMVWAWGSISACYRGVNGWHALTSVATGRFKSTLATPSGRATRDI